MAENKICNQECEIYSRITGYHRPLKNWNAGKTKEFADRVTYKVNLDKKIRPSTVVPETSDNKEVKSPVLTA